MPDKKRSIAIVGCGGMGAGHAWALSGRGGYEGEDGYSSYNDGQEAFSDLAGKLVLRGVYDTDAARMAWARENGFECYESYTAMLADEALDIVLIATPNHLHRNMALAALGAGKRVLCEKPVMLNAAELEDVMAAEKRADRIFYPRQNRRWDRDYLIAKRILDKGVLGDVFHIESCVLGSRGVPGDWRMQKACGGGMMLDWGVHLLDRLLQMVPGPVANVYCQLTNVNTAEVDDGFRIELTFESGTTALVECGTCHFIQKPLWYLAGSNGTAEINNWDCEGRIARLESWEDRDAKPILAGEGLTKTMAPRQGDTVKHLPLPNVRVDRDELYTNLVGAVNGVAAPLVTARQALRVLRLMEAAVKSGETGEVVHFNG